MTPRKASTRTRKPYSFKLPPELYKTLQHYAIDNDLEYSEVVENALVSLLKDYKQYGILISSEEAQ
jgi:hypothetical protein